MGSKHSGMSCNQTACSSGALLSGQAAGFAAYMEPAGKASRRSQQQGRQAAAHAEFKYAPIQEVLTF